MRTLARRTVAVLAIAVSFGLSGCGYHLRGQSDLVTDLGRVYVDASDVVAEDISVLLGGADAVSASREEADTVITVSNEEYAERVLSVDPATGKEREYELTYSVTFGVRSQAGEVLVPTQALTLVRDYVFDRDAVIGKSRERAVLNQEMRRDAVQQIVRRIEAQLGG